MTGARRQPITQRDLADALGVSTTTVSRSLRDEASLPAATRARVRRLARRMGYPDHALRGGRTRSRSCRALLLIVGDADDVARAEVVVIAARAAAANGATLLLHTGAAETAEHAAAIPAGAVDGVLLFGRLAGAFVTAVARAHPAAATVARRDELAAAVAALCAAVAARCAASPPATPVHPVATGPAGRRSA